jgi:hypothetical protein
VPLGKFGVREDRSALVEIIEGRVHVAAELSLIRFRLRQANEGLLSLRRTEPGLLEQGRVLFLLELRRQLEIVLPSVINAVRGLQSGGAVVGTEFWQAFVAELVARQVQFEQAPVNRAAMFLHARFELLRGVRGRELKQDGVARVPPLGREVVVEADDNGDDRENADEVVKRSARNVFPQPLDSQDQGIGLDLFALFRLHERSLLTRDVRVKSFVFG